MKIIRCIFSVVPLWVWIGLIIGFLLRMTDGSKHFFSSMIINVMLVYLFLRLTIIPHEIGHLIAARLTGGKAKRIMLGTSHEIVRFNFLGIKFVFNCKPAGGFAMATYDSPKFYRLRDLVYSSGGLIVNFTCAIIVYQIFGFDFRFWRGDIGIDAASAFILANSWVAIINFIPYKIKYYGNTIPNDGLRIIQNIFSRRKIESFEYSRPDVYYIFDYLEEKKPDEAIALIEKNLHNEKIHDVLYLDLGYAFYLKAEPETALTHFKKCEEVINDKEDKLYLAHCLINVAYMYLLLGDIEQADLYSQRAIDLSPHEKKFFVIRGIIHVEIGNYDNGLKYLEEIMSFHYVNGQTLPSAIYLGYIYHHYKKEKESKKYFDFVNQHDKDLFWDAKLFYTKIRERMTVETL